MKQTAVEWLIEQLNSGEFLDEELIKQAEEMFEQQIIDAYSYGRLSVINRRIISYVQYYNETFNK